MTAQLIQQVRQHMAENNHEALRMMPLSRYELRTIVLPIAREKLGEIPPYRARGLSSNWQGRGLMSRYG